MCFFLCYIFFLVFHTFALNMYVPFRYLDGGYCPFYWPKCPTQPCIHRHTLRFLHGGQCCYFQALCGCGYNQSAAYIVIPVLIFPHLHHLLLHLAIHATGEAQGLHALCYCSNRGFNVTNLPLHGYTSTKAWVLGCPVDAMAAIHLHLLEHIFVGVFG